LKLNSVSSRRASKESGAFVRQSPSNRSLERGLLILRAFRSGNSFLTTGEIAERTSLPVPTVSRLAATLVREGFLNYDFVNRGYCLGIPLLSLGQTFFEGSDVLATAEPLMRELARSQRVNVGLAAVDAAEIIYLQSIRGNGGNKLRHIVSGSRAPLELTSIGRAWLSAVSEAERERMYAKIAPRYREKWPDILADIRSGIKAVKEKGYCISRWQAGSVAIARPLSPINGRIYAINISFLETSLGNLFADEQAKRLIQLGHAIDDAFASRVAKHFSE
jgi:DNA-binding IclR family transcriptional regulator